MWSATSAAGDPKQPLGALPPSLEGRSEWEAMEPKLSGTRVHAFTHSVMLPSSYLEGVQWRM